MKIKSICIIGGGSSGWMTAAALSKNLPDVKITVVESPKIPTVGVGESTLGHINRYLCSIGLFDKDDEWMPHCNATYKVSIQFTDFKKLGHRFQYPFGLHDYTGEKTPSDWWHINALDPEYCKNNSYSEFYNPITYLADHNKMVGNNSIIRNFDFGFDTAYHFDAALFGEYLKNHICIPNGVKLIRDTITNVIKDNDGNIDFLIPELSPALKIKADLYIDCTGFNSLLLEKEMGSKFESFNNVLLNDSALAARIPFIDKEKELHNVTDCHALKNGWVWNIPLWNRIGTGYCYSSKFTTQEKAEEEFRSHLSKTDKKRAEEAEFFKINIRHGKREKAWVKNVVGIGLSYGFLEPLESTGLLTTHENILTLLDILQRRDGHVSTIDVDGFNLSVNTGIESMKDFIVMHYVFSQRDDSEYWKYIKYDMDIIDRDKLLDTIVRSPRLYQNILYDANVSHTYSDLSGTLYIAAGMGYYPIGKTEAEFKCRRNYLSEQKLHEVKKHHDRYKKTVMKYLPEWPSTYEYLKQTIYKDV